MTIPLPRLYVLHCPHHRAVLAPEKLTTCPVPTCRQKLNQLPAARLPERWQGAVIRYRKGRAKARSRKEQE